MITLSLSEERLPLCLWHFNIELFIKDSMGTDTDVFFSALACNFPIPPVAGLATLAGSFTGSGPGFSGSGGSAAGFGTGLLPVTGTSGLLAVAGTSGFGPGLLAVAGTSGFGTGLLAVAGTSGLLAVAGTSGFGAGLLAVAGTAGLVVTVGAAGFFPEVGGATDFHPAGLDCGDVDNADKGSVFGEMMNWNN